jgi:hypothetical protein
VKGTVSISRDLAKQLERLLGDYSIAGTYMAPRIGGVVAGCPRGERPRPEALAFSVRYVYEKFLEEVRPQWGASASTVATSAEVKRDT